MFYVGVSADLKKYSLNGDFTSAVRIGFAPEVAAKDRDDHILRSKLSTGSANGMAYFLSADFAWTFSDGLRFGVGGEYINISTDGTQYQYFYAGPYAGQAYYIDDKITSHQFSLIGNISQQF
jgi:hypothetical protein